MQIELYPGRGCQIDGIIGSIHQVPTMSVGETHLVLAKILLGKATTPPDDREARETSSADLIAQLETHLGDTITSYLTVRVTYQHSGFPNNRNSAMNTESLKSHFTLLQTEATATVRRHDSQSAWSPRASRAIANPMVSNPLVSLVETHLPPDKARETLKRLADEWVPLPLAKRSQQHLPGSSEETVKPTKSRFAATIDSAFATPLASPPSATVSAATLSGLFARLPQAHLMEERASSEVDPARKIWTEMRRNSRGGRNRHHRSSISADHYYSLEEESSPGQLSSGDTSVSTISNRLSVRQKAGDIEQERSRIMETALRNKRSVGAETLRSIAPSVVQIGASTLGKGNGAAFGGLGVGLTRTWGWGPPWW
jgi:hypothetical protein